MNTGNRSVFMCMNEYVEEDEDNISHLARCRAALGGGADGCGIAEYLGRLFDVRLEGFDAATCRGEEEEDGQNPQAMEVHGWVSTGVDRCRCDVLLCYC